MRTRTKAKTESIQMSQSDESNDEVINLPTSTMTMSKFPETKSSQAKQTSSKYPDSSNNNHSDEQLPQPQQQSKQNSEPKNIVEKIIADFAECETESTISEKQQQHSTRINSQHNFNELVIMCRNNVDKPSSKSKVRLLNHRTNRIISKNINALKHNITKVDLTVNQQQQQTTANGTAVAQCSASTNGTNKNLDKAAKAYEFSEDNEKCEKISTFRKRRLADKKYEFSEDNTENIIPYNKMRSVVRNPKLHQKISRHSPAHTNMMSYSSSPPSNLEMSASYHTHRASPSYG